MSDENFETGKIIVTLNKNITGPHSAMDHEDILQGIAYTKVKTIFNAGESGGDRCDILLVHLKDNDKATVIDAIERLSANPFVVSAEPNCLYGYYIKPNDPYYEHLWGMDKIHAPQAWCYTTGDAAVVVGVVDSGVDYKHPDIRDNMWTSESGRLGRNFIDDDDDPMDMTGHGTHVAGTIGAIGNNQLGVTGVNWRVRIASLKIGHKSFSLAAAIAAIDFANANRISILNNSWGGRFYSPALKHAIEQYDGLFVASAGNDCTDNDLHPDYPSCYDCDNIIAVAASDEDNGLADFSNYGAKSVHIAAPGTMIYSLSLRGEYSYQIGTSMAAPHVAGAAALLMAYKPELTVPEIKDIILMSAEKHPNLVGKVLTGGILDAAAMFEMANRC